MNVLSDQVTFVSYYDYTVLYRVNYSKTSYNDSSMVTIRCSELLKYDMVTQFISCPIIITTIIQAYSKSVWNFH